MGLKEFAAKRSLKVDDKKTTKAAELTLRESIFPLCLVTVLFFLWGFSYGLLDTLNKHFQNVFQINQSRSSGLQAAYFGAYPLASLGHAAWILRHYGYKMVFLWGLFLYGVGALCAIGAIKGGSFAGFCVCTFIMGSGLGSLETAANPYLAVCGPPKYAEIRINLAQAFNGIGTVISPAMSAYVFFATLDDTKALENVQWVYLAIACFVFCLGIAFLMTPIPEITDADMAFQAEESQANSGVLPFRKQYRTFHAAFAQFCYCGSQVAVASFFINYVVAVRPPTSDSDASKFLSGAQAAFTVGRFAGVLLMKYFKPRLVFLAFLALVIAFTAATPGARGDASIVMLYIILFFESIVFPTIVALGMRGLGRHSKRGSGLIVGGVIGGAVVPPLTGFVGDKHGSAISFVVPLCFFVAAFTYPVCVNFVPYYRDVADAFSETQVGLKGHHAGVADEENGSGTVAVGEKATDQKV